MQGRGALVALSKKCKEDEGWKHLDKDEETWLINQLKKSKTTKVSKKNIAHAGTDIEGTLSRVDPEVRGWLQLKSSMLMIVTGSLRGCQSERTPRCSMDSRALK